MTTDNVLITDDTNTMNSTTDLECSNIVYSNDGSWGNGLGISSVDYQMDTKLNISATQLDIEELTLNAKDLILSFDVDHIKSVLNKMPKTMLYGFVEYLDEIKSHIEKEIFEKM